MGDLTPDMRIGGYAPGNYMCRCIACDQQFIGDKRAVTCFDCAKEQVTTARTLELVAEWLEEDAVKSDAHATTARKIGRDGLYLIHAQIAATTRLQVAALRSGEFQAWLKEREARGG